MDKYTQKILENKNLVTLFYSDWCIYCQRAITLLNDKKIPYKGYDIDKIKGGSQKLFENLGKTKDLTGYKTEHTTRPLLFVNGKFLGGYDSLVKYVDK